VITSPEEQPVREVKIDSFSIDAHPVTVAEFRRLVEDTGQVTLAERPLHPAEYPDADSALLVRGSLVGRAGDRTARSSARAMSSCHTAS
jgi:formylglycine-generating enzyme